MPFHKIGTGMKERALQLIAEGWDLEQIVEALGVSGRSIGRWADYYETFGSMKPPAGTTGRPRLLNPAAIEGLSDLLAESPGLFLDEIAEYLALYHDQPISITALHDNLTELGLTRKIMQRAAVERDDALRAAWLEDTLLRYTADEIVFLDESSKDSHTIFRKYGRAPWGERPVIEELQDRGTQYSILPAITVDGYIAVRVVEGSVDGTEFFDFVLNDVLPQMEEHGLKVIILDNCKTHKSNALRELIEDEGYELLFLPPYSPDYNPIEESFSCLKAYLRRHWMRAQDGEFPERDLAEACYWAVNGENAKGWFRSSGYL